MEDNPVSTLEPFYLKTYEEKPGGGDGVKVLLDEYYMQRIQGKMPPHSLNAPKGTTRLLDERRRNLGHPALKWMF